MDRQTQRENELRAAQQAVEWLDALEQGRPADHKGFAQWLARSPVHVQEFLTMTAIGRYLDYVPADFRLDVAKLRGTAPQRIAPLMPVARDGLTRHLRRIRPLRFPRTLACAAALVIAAVAIAWWIHAAAWQSYSPGIGEQRAVELQDGSIV